jgi:hypothetical protein
LVRRLTRSPTARQTEPGYGAARADSTGDGPVHRKYLGQNCEPHAFLKLLG